MGNFSKIIIASLLVSMVCMMGFAQLNLHLSDFNASQGAGFVTGGPIGSTSWEVYRSGFHWGARIHNDLLELTNTADAGDRVDGWVFAAIGADALGESFGVSLDDNQQVISWYFNMRQIRTNPAGFGSGLYGSAFILAATGSNIATEGQGYAVVLGNTGTPDPLRLVKFSGGIQSIGSAAGGLIVASEPLENPTNSYVSIHVTYDPATSRWELWGRNDGASFADPVTGELGLLGSANDNQFTALPLSFMGAYWQGATAANQTAFFDNISIWMQGGGLPVISNVVQDPAMDIDSQTEVAVSAEVYPFESPITKVELEWGLASDQLIHTIPMLMAEPNKYSTSGPIPTQPDDAVVFYRVKAMDDEGNQSFSQIYSYSVKDPVADLIIVSIPPLGKIEVEKGILFDDLVLPDSVLVVLNDDSDVLMGVIWQQGDYDPAKPGEYAIHGLIQLIDGIVNPDNLVPVVVVEILPGEMYYTVTFRVNMSQVAGFDAQRDQVFVSGSMFDFAIPGTIPEMQLLVDKDNGDFEKTMELLKGFYSYRYFINGGFENQEPGPDRKLNLVSDTIVSDVWGALDARFPETDIRILIFPNPTRGMLHFSSCESVRQIDVFSLSSRLEFSVTPMSDRGFLDVSDLIPGFYILRFDTGNQIRHVRFAKITIEEPY